MLSTREILLQLNDMNYGAVRYTSCAALLIWFASLIWQKPVSPPLSPNSYSIERVLFNTEQSNWPTSLSSRGGLFGDVVRIEAPSTSAPPLPTMRIDITGVIVDGNTQLSSAILRRDNDSAKRYFIGEMVGHDARLTKVSAEGITLTRQGVEYSFATPFMNDSLRPKPSQHTRASRILELQRQQQASPDTDKQEKPSMLERLRQRFPTEQN